MSYYDYTPSLNNNASLIWTVVSIVVAIMGGLVIYFGFLSVENKSKGFLKQVHKFLNFKIFTIGDITKILYTMSAIGLTLFSFIYIKNSIWLFFLLLIGGNIVLRIGFEINMILYYIFKNAKEINNKIKK